MEQTFKLHVAWESNRKYLGNFTFGHLVCFENGGIFFLSNDTVSMVSFYFATDVLTVFGVSTYQLQIFHL